MKSSPSMFEAFWKSRGEEKRWMIVQGSINDTDLILTQVNTTDQMESARALEPVVGREGEIGNQQWAGNGKIGNRISSGLGTRNRKSNHLHHRPALGPLGSRRPMRWSPKIGKQKSSNRSRTWGFREPSICTDHYASKKLLEQ